MNGFWYTKNKIINKNGVKDNLLFISARVTFYNLLSINTR